MHMQNKIQGTWKKAKELIKGFFTGVTGKTGGSPLEARPIKERHMIFDSGRFKGVVYGGPYIQRPLGIVGVKMAEEIKKPCDVDIPTRDFDVPNVDKFKTGLVLGILYLKTRGELYVGCMGGIGRTGLYMAGLAKVMEELHTIDATKVLVKDAPLCVGYVREQYLSHAVETKQQIAWIEALDVRDIVAAVKNF